LPEATVTALVRVPNTALRFKPPLPADAIRALSAKYGLDDGARRKRGKQTGASGNSKGEPQSDTAVVWKLLADRTIIPVKIALGITDHAYTEVTALIAGDLKPGDDVVTTSVTAKSIAPGAQGFRR